MLGHGADAIPAISTSERLGCRDGLAVNFLGRVRQSLGGALDSGCGRYIRRTASWAFDAIHVTGKGYARSE